MNEALPTIDDTSIHLSLCTTCMGRTFHLKRTLPINLAILRRYPGSEVTLLNYNSHDDMDEWLKESLNSEVTGGLISYYRTIEPSSFFMAHAKNVAHRLARGRIVCNLDADHLLTCEFIDELLATFSHDQEDCVFVGQVFGIAFGRTALTKQLFIKLGGYDEEMCFGWGYEDNGFRIRAEKMGNIIRWANPAFLSYLEHGDEERSANSVTKHISVSEKRHAKISEANIAKGYFIANVGKHWGKATLTKNFTETISI